MKIRQLPFLSSFTVLVIASTTVLVVSGKRTTAQSAPPPAYQDALIDAHDPQPSELLDNLTAIDESNPDLIWDGQRGKSRLLVATFTSVNSYEAARKQFQNSDAIWVTIVPELKDFCTKYKATGVNADQLNKRLGQLLGLPPNGLYSNKEYNHIAEIWVALDNLKRPTLDPETNDRQVTPLPNSPQSSLPFSQGADSEYQSWFIKQRSDRKYPWTALGYTYDWGIYPKTRLQTDAGLSEFVIFPKSNSPTARPIEVKQILSTEEYCHTDNIGMNNLTLNTPLSVHYKSWTDEIAIQDKHIKHTQTTYEYDNPVSGNPSGSKQSVLTDRDLSDQQWEDLKVFIRSSGFEKLNDVYGAPEGYRYYPYNLMIVWGANKKEVMYRSNPSYGKAPLPFNKIENYLIDLSEKARK